MTDKDERRKERNRASAKKSYWSKKHERSELEKTYEKEEKRQIGLHKEVAALRQRLEQLENVLRHTQHSDQCPARQRLHVSPGPQYPSCQSQQRVSPVPQHPVCHSQLQVSPGPQNPVGQSQRQVSPGPQYPACHSQVQVIPGPQIPVGQSQQQVSRGPQYPTYQSQASPAPQYLVCQTQASPAPQYPVCQTQASPAPQYPVCQSQASPAPQYPTYQSQASTAPQYPVCQTQASTALQYPVCQSQASPASQYPVCQTQASPAPRYSQQHSSPRPQYPVCQSQPVVSPGPQYPACLPQQQASSGLQYPACQSQPQTTLRPPCQPQLPAPSALQTSVTEPMVRSPSSYSHMSGSTTFTSRDSRSSPIQTHDTSARDTGSHIFTGNFGSHTFSSPLASDQVSIPDISALLADTHHQVRGLERQMVCSGLSRESTNDFHTDVCTRDATPAGRKAERDTGSLATSQDSTALHNDVSMRDVTYTSSGPQSFGTYVTQAQQSFPQHSAILFPNGRTFSLQTTQPNPAPHPTPNTLETAMDVDESNATEETTTGMSHLASVSFSGKPGVGAARVISRTESSLTDLPASSRDGQYPGSVLPRKIQASAHDHHNLTPNTGSYTTAGTADKISRTETFVTDQPSVCGGNPPDGQYPCPAMPPQYPSGTALAHKIPAGSQFHPSLAPQNDSYTTAGTCAAAMPPYSNTALGRTGFVQTATLPDQATNIELLSEGKLSKLFEIIEKSDCADSTPLPSSENDAGKAAGSTADKAKNLDEGMETEQYEILGRPFDGDPDLDLHPAIQSLLFEANQAVPETQNSNRFPEHKSSQLSAASGEFQRQSRTPDCPLTLCDVNVRLKRSYREKRT